jgi:hypothetical protein
MAEIGNRLGRNFLNPVQAQRQTSGRGRLVFACDLRGMNIGLYPWKLLHRARADRSNWLPQGPLDSSSYSLAKNPLKEQVECNYHLSIIHLVVPPILSAAPNPTEFSRLSCREIVPSGSTLQRARAGVNIHAQQLRI